MKTQNQTQIIEENKQLREKNSDLETKLSELDRQVFYLKTLFDIAHEIAPLQNTQEIIKIFLMMIIGTFGIIQGFLFLYNVESGKIECFESKFLPGDFCKDLRVFLEKGARVVFPPNSSFLFFDQGLSEGFSFSEEIQKDLYKILIDQDISTFVPFSIDTCISGAIGLGKRITGESFSKIDMELLSTLIGQLVVHIKNVRSFETIQGLNEVLKEKNRTLEQTLAKINFLEKVKALLSKFVPSSLEKLIEAQPDSPDLTKRDQDITVLFLDIEGYSAISENTENKAVNALLERYFSNYFDEIHRQNGEINLSLGDGLMILYQDEDKRRHAINALRTAYSIKHKTREINKGLKEDLNPLVINIGIHSGMAFIGASRFNGFYGARWVYTALGATVNLASRIGAFAKKGDIVVSYETFERTKKEFYFKPLGPQYFKNIKKPIEVYKVISPKVFPW